MSSQSCHVKFVFSRASPFGLNEYTRRIQTFTDVHLRLVLDRTTLDIATWSFHALQDERMFAREGKSNGERVNGSDVQSGVGKDSCIVDHYHAHPID